MENSFYCYLPCKRFNDQDPVDKPENYVSYLPQNIDLEDEWEVGVTEITFPKSWTNVPYNQSIELVYYDKNSKPYFNTLKLGEIKADHYKIEDLIKTCNDVINNSIYKNETDDSEFFDIEDKVNKITQKPILELDDKIIKMKLGVLNENEFVYLRFSRVLGNIIGFHEGETNFIANLKFAEYSTFEKEHPTDSLPKIESNSNYIEPYKEYNLKDGIQLLFISSDVCKTSIYGPLKQPILKIVDVPKGINYGDQVTQIYDNPQYVPIYSRSFNNIGITVFDYLNYKTNKFFENLVPFRYGLFIITLHFRRVNKKPTSQEDSNENV